MVGTLTETALALSDLPPLKVPAARFNEEMIPNDWAEIRV